MFDFLKQRKKKVDEEKKSGKKKQPGNLSFEHAANTLQKRRIEQQKLLDSL